MKPWSFFLSILVLLLILGVATSCSDDDDDEEVTVPNSLVTAVVNTPVGVQKNEVVIRYSLVDPDADLANVQVRYSTNGGGTYEPAPATEFAGSSGTFNLATAPFPGVSHTFVWDSLTDLGNTSGNLIRIRVTPSDSELGISGASLNFPVDNTIKPPPAAVVDPTTSPQSGDVMITYTLYDQQSVPATIAVEYTTNFGASWGAATEVIGAPSQGTAALATAPPPTGFPHIFVWDTLMDGVGTNATGVQSARIRITPWDLNQVGTPGQSPADFTVDNTFNSTPTVTVAQPNPPPLPPTGTLPINYTLADAESDRVSIAVEFSTNGGATYAPAIKGIGGDPLFNLPTTPGGISYAFNWNTLANVGATLQNACRIRITPSDGAPGTPDVNPSNFTVDNSDSTSPWVTAITDAATNSQNQRVVIDFSETLQTTSVVLGASPPATFAVFQDTDTIPGGTFAYFPGAIAFQNQDRRLLFFPDAAFQDDREIRVVLTSGMTDVAGNGLIDGGVVPSDPLTFQGTFSNEVFEDAFNPFGIPDCARYLPDPDSDIWYYDFDFFGTFDQDLQARGLRGSSATVNALARDQVMARILYTMSDKYEREPTDGSAKSGAYKISFVCIQPPGSLGTDYSRMCVGRDEGGLLGQAYLDQSGNRNKENDCSTSIPLGTFSGGISGLNSSLSPALGASDLKYLDGTYSLGSGTPSEDARFRDIDEVIDDWGHAVGVVGSHETGHSVGLVHDDGNSLNIMRSSASQSFLSNENARFSSGSRSVLNNNLGLVP